MSNSINKRRIGTFYEEAAIEYLRSRGVQIVDRNVTCGSLGEIDIIGIEKDCLLFIECKYRSGNSKGSSLDAVGRGKQKTIRRCAEYYLFAHGEYSKLYIRFDVIGIDGDSIEWIKNAF